MSPISSLSSAKRMSSDKEKKEYGRISQKECQVCSEIFTKTDTLNIHLLTHNEQNLFRCAQDDQSISQTGNLKTIRMKHGGEKTYNCSQCDHLFTQNGTLKRHMMKHSGEKPYNCAHCDLSFTLADNIKMHMLKHTGQKPHNCAHKMLRLLPLLLLCHVCTSSIEPSYNNFTTYIFLV